jgi:hypothetical protein
MYCNTVFQRQTANDNLAKHLKKQHKVSEYTIHSILAAPVEHNQAVPAPAESTQDDCFLSIEKKCQRAAAKAFAVSGVSLRVLKLQVTLCRSAFFLFNLLNISPSGVQRLPEDRPRMPQSTPDQPGERRGGDKRRGQSMQGALFQRNVWQASNARSRRVDFAHPAEIFDSNCCV